MGARDRMTVEELLRLLDAGEGESVEFKSALPNGDDVASTMAAFANTRGGTLLVGVSDDRRPVGVEAPDVVMQRLASLTRDACRPALNCEIGNAGIGALTVVWVRVPARPQVPTRVRGLRYVRVGPTTRVDDIGLTKEALTAPIPPRLEKFRGRERELSHLQQNVLRGSAPIIVVGGISGIGKTALAARLASLIEADGYRVFWRECHPETTLDVVTLELGRVARASGDLGLADVLEEAEESELLDDRLVRIVSALARCRYGVFLDDYHRVVDTRLDRLLVALANRGGLTKAILCVSRRPPMLDQISPSTRVENYLEVGLDAAECERFLRDAMVKVDQESARKVFAVCGRGHPKALSLFAALAARIPVDVLLRSLPVFRDRLHQEWLQPLLNALHADERLMLIDLAIFDRPVPIAGLRQLYRERAIDLIVARLVNSFLVDYVDRDSVRMHDLLREFCYPLINDQARRHNEAAALYMTACEESDDDSSLDDRQLQSLLAAWSHYIQAGETSRAASVLGRLRPTLMHRGQYDQLLFLLEQTPPQDVAGEAWRAIDRARILGLRGEIDAAVAVLEPLVASRDDRLVVEATLVLAAIYNGQARSKEALDLLGLQSRRFARLQSGRASMRLFSRVAEAYLLAGDAPKAFDLATRISGLSDTQDDRVSGGIALRHMATACLAQGHAERALGFAMQSRELLGERVREAALSDIQIALVREALGNRDGALSLLEDAHAALVGASDRVSATSCRRHISRIREAAGPIDGH